MHMLGVAEKVYKGYEQEAIYQEMCAANLQNQIERFVKSKAMVW